MTNEERHYIKTAIGALEKLMGGASVEPKAALDRPQQAPTADQRIAQAGAEAKATKANVTPLDEEALYQRFKARFIDDAKTDPILLQLMLAQPEIVVEIEPRIVTIDGSSTKGRVARLMASGWFATTRKPGTVRAELTRTGTDPGSGGRLSEALTEYVAQGFLTRDGDGYLLAPGVKVSEKELKVV